MLRDLPRQILPFVVLGALTFAGTQAEPDPMTDVEAGLPALDCDPHTKACSPAVHDEPVPEDQAVERALLLPPGWEPEGTSSHDDDPATILDASVDAEVNVTTPWGTIHIGAHLVANLSGPPHEHGEQPDGGASPMVPCRDPAGCPDLTLDPTLTITGMRVVPKHFEEDDCNVLEGTAAPGDRRLLRFTTTTPNFGEGKLVLGKPSLNPDWFTWGDCHGHWHLIDYADYRLWTVEGYLDWREARKAHPNATAAQVLDAHPDLAPEMVNGHKQGFCVIDIRQYLPLPSNFWGCFTEQGISPGWADEYGFPLDGQWIDVTDVEPGIYVLELEVNAERFFEESDYSNNAFGVLTRIPDPEGV